MNHIEKLAGYFKEFPGIGERQAKRFVYFLLHKHPKFLQEFSSEILSLNQSIHQCPSCFIFFQGGKGNLCETCGDPKTDRSTLLIVEKDFDYEALKKSKNYNGLYFILGGLVPIVTKDTPNFIRTKELLRSVEDRSKSGELKEVILALSLNPQGENTDVHLREILSPIIQKHSLKLSSLGRGLSTGTELEYSDSETIKNALRNRI